jgi:ABC-type nitrate/sulfonate/bicarbonate transport system substrate-binding protein
MHRTRHTSLGLALAAVLVIGSVAVAPTAAVPVRVKQAGFKVVDLAVPFLAQARGAFARHGLAWEYVEIDSGKLGVSALLSGNVQFVDLALDDVVALKREGRDRFSSTPWSTP